MRRGIGRLVARHANLQALFCLPDYARGARRDNHGAEI